MSISAKISASLPESMLRVEIADNGVGIADDIIDDVMEPFFTTRTKGTGLGLAIVKSIIERHGGKFELTSRVGAGTKVSFTLPTMPEES